MAISTVNVDFSAILQNAAQATGLLRVRLSQVGTVEDSETGDKVILPIAWQETTLTDGAATLALVPNKLIEPSCTYYEIQLKSVPDCPKACAKLLLSGIMYVPDEDCNVLDLLISPPSPETANTASGYASQAKRAAQVAENFAIQAGDRYDDVAEAAATALTDIGTAKQDALDAIGTAQSGATEAISTAEESALQAIGQARGTALDDIGTAQGLAEDAQAAAESASTDAQGYAGDASTSAGQAAQSASDAADSATAAQASAESIAASAVQIQTNADNITALETKTDITNKNVANIQALLNGTLYREDTDSAEAYSKSVPTGAMPYATINEIGGRTVVWNQLINPALFGRTTYDGITTEINLQTSLITIINNSRDTSYASGSTRGKLHENLITGHKYICIGKSTRSLTGLAISCFSGSSWYDVMLNNIFTNEQDVDRVNFRVTSQYDFISEHPIGDVMTLTVSLIDLTLMFGAGNEPATVAEFEAMFPSIDPAYNAGELRSAGVTEAVSKYRTVVWNQLGRYDKRRQEAPCWGVIDSNVVSETSTSITVQNAQNVNYWLTSTIQSGHRLYVSFDILMEGDAVDPVYINFGGNIINTGTSLTANTLFHISRIGTQNGTSYSHFYIYPNGTSGSYIAPYTISNFIFIDLTLMFGAGNEPATVAEFEAVFPSIDPAYNAGTEISYNIAHNQGVAAALEVGSTLATLPVPSAIQALPGYGWSAGTHDNSPDVYNGFSFVTKMYAQRIAKYEFTGAETIILFTTGDNYNAFAFQAPNLGRKGGWTCPYRSSHFQIFTTAVLGGSSWISANGYAWAVYMPTTYTSADVVKTWLAQQYAAGTPVTFYYELETPLETNVSDLLTGDNLIEVEAGGTVTFKNQHGDDWRVPVPNAETYLVQATPELPTTDGTYTLQCTVTDGTPSVTWVTA